MTLFLDPFYSLIQGSSCRLSAQHKVLYQGRKAMCGHPFLSSCHWISPSSQLQVSPFSSLIAFWSCLSKQILFRLNPNHLCSKACKSIVVFMDAAIATEIAWYRFKIQKNVQWWCNLPLISWHCYVYDTCWHLEINQDNILEVHHWMTVHYEKLDRKRCCNSA